MCNKNFEIASLGTSALRSHMDGKKHKERVNIVNSTVALPVQRQDSGADGDQSSGAGGGSAGQSSVTSSQPPKCRCKCCDHMNMDMRSVTNRELKVADIWWALNMVDSGFSFSSCNNIAFVMKQLFPDSSIASKFTLGETKCMYVINYGLAPFCKKLLTKKLSGEPFVLMFDESPNKRLQLEQLDVLVRFWDCGSVKSRFLDSSFMGHSTAKDLLEEITNSLENLVCRNSYSYPWMAQTLIGVYLIN